MYTVYADGKLLYHPAMVHHGYPIYDAEVVLEANKSGSFQFKMPVTNSLYNSLKKMSTIITVYDDATEIFRGRILNDERDFNNTKLVYCEGELAFLLDSIFEPQKVDLTIKEFFKLLITNHNSKVEASKRFEFDEEHSGQIGKGVTVLPDTKIAHEFTEYDNTWNVFNSYLLDQYGGYIRVRSENGHRYLDYISSYGSISNQVVTFGTNMLDMTQYVSAESVFTTLIPLGASYAVELEDSEVKTGQILKQYTEPVKNKNGDLNFVFGLEVIRNSKNKERGTTNITVNYSVRTVSGTASWSGLSGDRIYADIQFDTGLPDQQDENKTVKVEQKKPLPSGNITSTEAVLISWEGDVATKNIVITGEFINQYTDKDGKPTSNSMAVVAGLLEQRYLKTVISSVNDGKNYLEDANAKSLFGTIMATHEWPDVDDPAELKTLAQEYLKNNIEMSVRLDINAVDLHELNVNYESFKIGDTVKVLSAPHEITDANKNNSFVVNKISLNLQNPDMNTYSLGAEYKTLTETQITAAKDIKVTNDMIQQVINDLGSVDSIVQEMTQLVNTIYDRYADVTTVINNLDTAYAEIDFANIDTAAINNAIIEQLIANTATIENGTIHNLQAGKADIDFANITEAAITNLVSHEGFIETLGTTFLKADFANFDSANINEAYINWLDAGYLKADFANISQAAINYLTANYLQSNFANLTQARVDNLFANTAYTNALTARYASVDLANITTAAVTKMLGNTGVFTQLQVNQDLTVTGSLNTDLISAGTIKADRLYLQGQDGIYYQLNVKRHDAGDISETDWQALTSDQLQNAFHGENIIANTITAKQIKAGSITAQELAVLDASTVKFNDGSTTTSMSTFITDLNGLTANYSTLENKVDSTVKSYAYTYGYGTSDTSHPADSAFTYTAMPPKVDGQYIWRRTTITKTNNTSTKTYEMIQGIDGHEGQDGKAIVRVEPLYYLKKSSENAPAAPTEKVINTGTGPNQWTLVAPTYVTESVTYSYGYGTSDTTAPADSEFIYPVIPEEQSGKFIWVKTDIHDPVDDSHNITYKLYSSTDDYPNDIYSYYYWSCNQLIYDDNSVVWGDVVLDTNVNNIYSSMKQMNSSIIANSQEISTRVSLTEYANYQGTIDGKFEDIEDKFGNYDSKFIQTAKDISLRVTSDEVSKQIKDDTKDIVNDVKTIKDSYLTVEDGQIKLVSSQATVLNTQDITNLQNQIRPLATAFVVKSDGTYVYSVDSSESIMENYYTKTDSKGLHVHVAGNEVTWATADGTGTPALSIGNSSTDTTRWQFKRSNGLLNISWHG